jgi:hypothetical protein
MRGTTQRVGLPPASKMHSLVPFICPAVDPAGNAELPSSVTSSGLPGGAMNDGYVINRR